MMAQNTLDPDLSEWRRVWYDQALTDIRWAKERGWNITYGAVALLGAVYAAVLGWVREPELVFPKIALAVALVAVYWLADLAHFAEKARRYVDYRLGPLAPTVDARELPYPFLRGTDPHHYWHFLVQGWAVTIGAGIVLVFAVDNTCGLLVAAGLQGTPPFGRWWLKTKGEAIVREIDKRRPSSGQ